jgi:phosphopentomutase
MEVSGLRAFLLVLDSVGIGAAPDAEAYGDAGANTLAHLAAAVGGLNAPTLARLGLGNIPDLLPERRAIAGVARNAQPAASYGAMRELSSGKDTTTGHWEIAGLEISQGFHVFPPAYPSFPAALVDAFARATGRGILANRAASGTRIIAELGDEQMRTGKWIVYTSADSVMQIAAHEGVIPLAELYAACETARALCNPYRVGRVIARPFVGAPGAFVRTENRRDFSFPLPEPTILNRALEHGIPVITVGKLDDIFAHSGITEAIHVENNRDAQAAMLTLARAHRDQFVFANFIDFDMLYGHRRDARGYARAIEDADRFLDRFLPLLGPGDLLIVTADHGNDPTFRGTDHTREYVPLLAYRSGRPGLSLGIRQGFFDVAQSVAAFFGLDPMPRGASFIQRTTPAQSAAPSPAPRAVRA